MFSHRESKDERGMCSFIMSVVTHSRFHLNVHCVTPTIIVGSGRFPSIYTLSDGKQMGPIFSGWSNILYS